MTPDALPDPVAVAVWIAEALDRVGVRYVVGGSLASSLYGEQRSTNDIEFVAALSAGIGQQFVEALGPEYYISASSVEGAVRAGCSFSIMHMRAGVKIDVFVAASDPLDRERLRRRRHVNVSRDESTAMAFRRHAGRHDSSTAGVGYNAAVDRRSGSGVTWSASSESNTALSTNRIFANGRAGYRSTDLLDAARADADQSAGST